METLELAWDITVAVMPFGVALTLTAIVVDYGAYRIRERLSHGGSDRPTIRETIQEKGQ